MIGFIVFPIVKMPRRMNRQGRDLAKLVFVSARRVSKSAAAAMLPFQSKMPQIYLHIFCIYMADLLRWRHRSKFFNDIKRAIAPTA
jgi:hypothetical protein